MTNSGGSIGAYGMGDSLRSSGFEVAYAFSGSKADFDKNSGKSDFQVFYAGVPDDSSSANRMKTIVQDWNPSLLWIHPIADWPLAAPFDNSIPHVVMAGDPMDRIIRFRFKFSAQANRFFFLKPYYFVKNRREAKSVLKRDAAYLKHADQNGVCSAYGPGDVDYHRRESGANVQLCQLAFPDLGARRTYTGAKKFLLLGNLTTIHTRYGLYYFFNEVFPKWMSSKVPQSSEIRLVGAGKMSQKIKVPKDQTGFKYVGFAESLDEEFANTLASIVTVPIDIGFRTRVIECWMKGIPVIMDASSAKGLPSVKGGKNCLIARNGDEFVKHAEAVLENPELAEQIGNGGRETFLNTYLSTSEESKNPV